MARAVLAEQRLVDLKAMLEETRAERDAGREQAQRLALIPPTPRTLPSDFAMCAPKPEPSGS
jgi:hypothetical protein